VRIRSTVIAVAVAAGVLALAACSSDSSGKADTGPSGESGSTIKIGALTSLTGPFASSYSNFEDGVKARIDMANAEGGVAGHKLTYVIADDKSAGPETVAAAEKLIQQDHVFGIVTASSSLGAAVDTLNEAKLPVIAANVGGLPDFSDPANTGLFDVYGYGKQSVVTTTLGEYLKSQGATKIAAIGYGNSPNSKLGTQNAVESAKAAGLEVGFFDTTLSAGSTDVGPLIQKIKDSGADAVYSPVVPATGYALVKGLARAGVHLKAAVLATGYAQAVIDDPANREAAKGVSFMVLGSPIEAQTAGTKEFSEAIAKYAGVTGIPDFSQYLGWMATDAFVDGLSLPGAADDPATFMTELRKATWDGAGLQAPINYADVKPTKPLEDQNNCTNFVLFDGQKFTLQGGKPVCGKVVEGVTVG